MPVDQFCVMRQVSGQVEAASPLHDTTAACVRLANSARYLLDFSTTHPGEQRPAIPPLSSRMQYSPAPVICASAGSAKLPPLAAVSAHRYRRPVPATPNFCIDPTIPFAVKRKPIGLSQFRILTIVVRRTTPPGPCTVEERSGEPRTTVSWPS